MKKTTKKLLLIMCVIFMVYSLLCVSMQKVYAENENIEMQTETDNEEEVNTDNETAGSETGDDSEEDNTTGESVENVENQNNNASSGNETTKNTSTTVNNKKSSNAKLKNLGIKPHDFSGFKAGKTSYDVTVPNDTEEVEVYAIAQDSNAKLSGTGTKKLEIGKNEVSVVVTAEDGTKQTYTINITREEADEDDENTENVQQRYSGEGLASLKIEDLELSPEFDTTIYEYTVKYIGEDAKLDIETTTTDPYYETEVVGNSDLKEGENIITILVSDPDGNNVATYQITLNKSKVDEEALAKEQEEKQKAEQKKYLIIGVVVAVTIFVIVIIVIIRYRKNKVLAKEYSIPFSDLYGEKNQLENYDEKMDYAKEQNDQTDLSKEEAKKEFLNNYNKDNQEQYEEIEETRRKKHKGKRFK